MSHAEITLYSCKIKKTSASWIPSELYITVAEGKAQVIDPIIEGFIGKPIAAQISVDNAKRISFVWELKGMKSGSGQYAGTFKYYVTVLKPEFNMSIRANPVSYSNDFNGNGKCTVQTK